MVTVIAATKSLFQARNYVYIFFALLPAIFFVFILIPVRAIPGNDFAFQMSIFTIKDYALLIALAPLISLVLTMQLFVFKRNRSMRGRLQSVGTGTVGGYSGILATVFATAACSSCIAVLFGFLGAGAILFIVEQRWVFILITIALMFFSLYFMSRKVVGICRDC